MNSGVDSIKRKYLSCLFVICFLLCMLCACGRDSKSDQAKDGTVRVMVAVDEGITVMPDAVLDLNPGEDAVFTLQFAEGFAFESATCGEFDAESGTLTLRAVEKATLITVKSQTAKIPEEADIRFLLKSTSDDDKASVSGYGFVRDGEQIRVYAGNNRRKFEGWSFGSDGEIVSTDRKFIFKVDRDLAEDGVFIVRPHYSSVSKFYYDANGGVIDKTTDNAKGNNYSRAIVSENRIEITLTSSYLEKMSCATAFWNDGTFSREGYILKEYNTSPDGKGEAYQPGSKVYAYTGDDSDFVLYCIWEKVSEADFTYEPYSMPLPSGVKKQHAPDWRTDGVIITEYKGNADTLIIPEYLEGKPVIAIRSGAVSNKKFTTLYLSRTLQEVQDGAFSGCSSLKTLYFPGGIWNMGNDAFDAATYKNWTKFYVYASIAPRYSTAEAGAFGIRLSRIISTADENRLVAIAGSSMYQSLGSAYLEALLDYDYAVINFGTIRMTHGPLYMEAMQHYLGDGDIVLFAPENSIYMMGDNGLRTSTIRDMECMYELFQHVDISKYTNVFGAFRDQNQENSYKRAPGFYDNVAGYAGMNAHGDDVKKAKAGYVGTTGVTYNEAYYILFSSRYKSTGEGTWKNAKDQLDYTDDRYWVDINTSPYMDMMNRIIRTVQADGTKVFFGFAPSDEYRTFDVAKNRDWLAAYDKLMKETYCFDGILGSCHEYIYNHQYFYDCAYHTNNYGRTWHTYNFYTDLCPLLGREILYQNGEVGTYFEGCLFEKDADGNLLTSPKFPVEFLSGK